VAWGGISVGAGWRRGGSLRHPRLRLTGGFFLRGQRPSIAGLPPPAAIHDAVAQVLARFKEERAGKAGGVAQVDHEVGDHELELLAGKAGGEMAGEQGGEDAALNGFGD